MKYLFTILILLSLPCMARECYKIPFLKMGVKTLKAGSCQLKDFASPLKQALACKSSVLNYNDKNYWLEQLSSAELAKKFGKIKEYTTGNHPPVMSRKECLNWTALIITAKAHKTLQVRFENLGNAVGDMGGKFNKDLVYDCMDAIRSVKSVTNKIQVKKLKVCSLISGDDIPSLKKDLCQLVPWTCSISFSKL